jgi:hypothetical protein
MTVNQHLANVNQNVRERACTFPHCEHLRDEGAAAAGASCVTAMVEPLEAATYRNADSESRFFISRNHALIEAIDEVL